MDHILCSQNLMIFIGGHGSNESSSKLDSDKIFAEMGRNKAKIPLRSVEYIINNADRSTFPAEVTIPPHLIKCVQEATESVIPSKKKKGISLVFFVHSLGAHVIYEALHPSKINLGDRSHIAIFSFGGTQEIPSSFAGIVINFVIKGDELAYLGKWWHDGKLKDGKRVVSIDATQEQKKRVEDAGKGSGSGFFMSSAGASAILVNPVLGSATAALGAARGIFAVTSAVVASPHYSHDYFGSAGIFKHIFESLSINDPESLETCKCTKRNVMKDEWINKAAKKEAQKQD